MSSQSCFSSLWQSTYQKQPGILLTLKCNWDSPLLGTLPLLPVFRGLIITHGPHRICSQDVPATSTSSNTSGTLPSWDFCIYYLFPLPRKLFSWIRSRQKKIFFCKGPNNKYFRLFGPQNFCCNNSPWFMMVRQDFSTLRCCKSDTHSVKLYFQFWILIFFLGFDMQYDTIS